MVQSYEWFEFHGQSPADTATMLMSALGDGKNAVLSFLAPRGLENGPSYAQILYVISSIPISARRRVEVCFTTSDIRASIHSALVFTGRQGGA